MRTRTPTSPKTAVRRLAIGRLISVTGGAAAYTALNFTVWDRTHSPGMQALSLMLTFGVAGILGPFAGALGDRFDRRRVMIASEAVASAFFIAMVFVEDPGLLIAIAFGSAIAELPFFSASRAAIPNLVEHEEDISWANSLITVGVHAGIAVGPLLGGLIVAGAGARWVFGINAVSFVISLVLTITVHGRFADPVREVSQDEDRGITAGIRFLFGEAVLRRMSLAWVVFVLGMGMGMVADAPIAESFTTSTVLSREPVSRAATSLQAVTTACVGAAGAAALGTASEPVQFATTSPVTSAVAMTSAIAIAVTFQGFQASITWAPRGRGLPSLCPRTRPCSRSRTPRSRRRPCRSRSARGRSRGTRSGTRSGRGRARR